MKYFVVTTAAVSSNAFTFNSKSRFSVIRALLLSVFAGLSFISADTYMAAATVSPSSLSWAGVQVGNTGGPKSVILTNNSGLSITIKSVVVGGTNPTDFLISTKTCGSSLG